MIKLPEYIGIGLVWLLLVMPAQSEAQVSADKINNSLLKESVKAVLGTDQQVTWHQIKVADSIRNALKKKLKAKNAVPDTIFIGTVETSSGISYFLPDIAPSRSEKFSYLLYFNEQKKITGIDVLAYRESYGYEIDYDYFRNQFKGKQKPEEIIFRRNIQNISGATISARSLTNATHDLLLIINEIALP